LHLMTLGIGTSGTVVYMPPGGLSGAPYATLQGRPLLATEFNATLGTQGDLIKADLGQMLSISKGGIMSAASIHVEFLTDQLALRFIMRLNAQPWESAPITPYKGTSNTQSNFVALDTRS
jgi:HK97 family phage major capsid protein